MAKGSKDKSTITVHQILHKILKTLQTFCEICKVLKNIIALFL